MPDPGIKHVATIRPGPRVRLARRPRRRSILREFALNTSTHGIPGIARSQSRHNRLFWTVSLLIYTGVMLFFIISSISEYFAYPTQTLVSMNEEWGQAFPAVTICNHSPVRLDRFIQPFLEYANERNLTDGDDEASSSDWQAEHVDDFLRYRLNRNESVEEFFYSIQSMLINCTYNKRECVAEDFVSFISSRYGLCHTFNGKTDRIRNGTVFRATENGEDGLLTLRLYAHGHQYVPGYADGMITFDSPQERDERVTMYISRTRLHRDRS